MKCVKTFWTYSSTIIRNISKSTTARLVLMLELVQLLGLLGIVNSTTRNSTTRNSTTVRTSILCPLS